MEKWEKIKVDKKIKPIHFKNRKPVELIIGKEYYVSFGMNEASCCMLTKIDKVQNKITIEVPPKSISDKGYIDVEGNFFYPDIYTHILFPDEIGLTPEEAVINQVTS